MDTRPIRQIGNVHIEHAGDVNHGLEHIDRAWNSPEIVGAFREARRSGSGEFRNRDGHLYSLKHEGGDKFSLEYRGH